LDPGSDDTIFPLDAATLIGAPLRSEANHSVRWRGRRYALAFGDVYLELVGDTETWRWPAVIGFCDAPIRYPLLGIAGCLQFFNATFLGARRVVELEKNRSYPGVNT
jgi:hypothetical protein